MIEEMNRKRKKQFGKLVKYRYYQIGIMLGALTFYLFIWRKWLVAQPVMNSIPYKMAADYIKANKVVRNKIGQDFQIMNCNGKMYPYKKDVKFDIVMFGTSSNGKVKIISFYDKVAKTWGFKKIDLYTRTEVIPLIH